jgi:hypothetical protein
VVSASSNAPLVSQSNNGSESSTKSTQHWRDTPEVTLWHVLIHGHVPRTTRSKFM